MQLSKKRNRDRMRMARATYVQPKVVQPTDSKQEKLAELRKLITEKQQPMVHGSSLHSGLPIYNPAIHKPGDKVLFKVGKKMVETVVPELDGAGQPIQDYW